MSFRRGWQCVAIMLVAATAASGAVGFVTGRDGSSSSPTPTWADLAYGSDPAQVLDLWLPAQTRQSKPLVIFVHGGGFSVGDKYDVGPKVTPLLSAGYAVASIDYRLVPHAVFPAAARDLRAAVRFLRSRAAQWRIDPDRFALWESRQVRTLPRLSRWSATGTRFSTTRTPRSTPPRRGCRRWWNWFGPIDLAGRAAQYRTGGSDCRDPQLVQADQYTTGYLGAEVDRVPERAAAANPMTYLRSATGGAAVLDRARHGRLLGAGGAVRELRRRAAQRRSAGRAAHPAGGGARRPALRPRTPRTDDLVVDHRSRRYRQPARPVTR